MNYACDHSEAVAEDANYHVPCSSATGRKLQHNVIMVKLSLMMLLITSTSPGLCSRRDEGDDDDDDDDDCDHHDRGHGVMMMATMSEGEEAEQDGGE